MKVVYADPPYFGCCGLYGHRHETPFGCWDEPATHRALITHLMNYDSWALSLSSPSLEEMLHLCREVLGPNQVRVGSWVKPFASFKPNVNPAFAWEPVIFWGGRKRGRELPTLRDWIAENITMQKGLTGAKPLNETQMPKRFCRSRPPTHPGDRASTRLRKGAGVGGRNIPDQKSERKNKMFAVKTNSKSATYPLAHRGISYDIEKGDHGVRYWINADAGWSRAYRNFDSADEAAKRKIDSLLAKARK